MSLEIIKTTQRVYWIKDPTETRLLHIELPATITLSSDTITLSRGGSSAEITFMTEDEAALYFAKLEWDLTH